MWTELRQDIDRARKDINVKESDFHAVPIDQWKNIQVNIYKKFCNLESFDGVIWIWSFFKLDQYAVAFDYNWPFDQLVKLIDHTEKVWLILNETVASQGEKFWFYEGYINPIVAVLNESQYTDEVYIASKKYEWVICINHDDKIIATGKDKPQKLKELEGRLKGKH